MNWSHTNMRLFWIFVTCIPCSVYSLTTGPSSSYIHVPGKMLPGPFTRGSVKVAKNLTLNECAAECSLEYRMNQFPCYAFEHAAREHTCLMTNVSTLVTKGGYLGLRPNSAMDYYERPKGTYQNLFQPFPNQILQQETSYYAVFKNKTLDKCALFCLMETRKPCMSFSYSEKKQACGLSSVFYTSNNGQNLRRSTDYNHYQYYTTWPCNATIPWNYSPRAIASPYFPYVALQDVDCYLIIEAPEGKQVDLQFSTFYTKSSLCDTTSGISVYDGRTNKDGFMSHLCSSDHFVDRRYQSSSGALYVHFSTGSIPMAFKATYDFIQIDLCQMAPCRNGGSCRSTSGGYECDCLDGFTGSNCETDIDECASNPCYLGGQCVDRINGFECKCPSLLGGARCNVFVGLCHLHPCKNGGSCSPRGTDRYICTCPEGFRGVNCTEKVRDPCDDNPCQNGADCISNIKDDTYQCRCIPGFTGHVCETDIDECSSNPCLHNFKCHDLVNDYKCVCPEILGGKNCELFLGGCSIKPCIHGQCEPTGPTTYTCKCEGGYKGLNCSEPYIDFCDPKPCKNGGCTSSNQGPVCSCDLGFTGYLCETKIDFCDGVDCNQGECVSLEDGFRCSCLPGYEGKYCNQTVNHCTTADCGGGFCINTVTSHFCVCKGGYTGATCDTEALDQCEAVCANGSCVTTSNDVMCICEDGFTGNKCDTLIDYCITEPCVHGQCLSVSGGYNCTCDDNYSGINCDDVIDYCIDNKCVFGFCNANSDGYDCLCGQGYHGKYCELREGETAASHSATTEMSMGCSAETCRYGTCDSDFLNVCVCLLGYEGEHCDRFVGCSVFDPCVHGSCVDYNGSYMCNCSEEYSGQNCEVEITGKDPCALVICQNEGTCKSINQSDGAGYQCMCTDGYHGLHCEYINACRPNLCRDSTCVPVGNGVRCEMSTLSGTGNLSTSYHVTFAACYIHLTHHAKRYHLGTP